MQTKHNSAAPALDCFFAQGRVCTVCRSFLNKFLHYHWAHQQQCKHAQIGQHPCKVCQQPSVFISAQALCWGNAIRHSFAHGVCFVSSPTLWTWKRQPKAQRCIGSIQQSQCNSSCNSVHLVHILDQFIYLAHSKTIASLHFVTSRCTIAFEWQHDSQGLTIYWQHDL